MTEFSNIIDGKHISFIIDSSFVEHIKELQPIMDKILEGANITTADKSTKEMVSAYKSKNWTEFFAEFYGLIAHLVISIFKSEPRLIVTNPYLVSISFSFSEENYLANVYVQQHDDENVLININITNSFQNLLLNREDFRMTIYHELIHNLYHHHANEANAIMHRYDNLYKKRRGSFKDIYLIEKIISNSILEARMEGFTKFLTAVKHNRQVPFYFSSIKEWKNCLESIVELDNVKQLKKIGLFLSQLSYHIGPIMVAVIVISHLFQEGKKFSVWIVQQGLLTGQEQNAIGIKKFWMKEDFMLKFTDEAGALVEIQRIADEISKLSHLQFLREYEVACKYLDITPEITLHLYNYYKNKAYENWKFKIILRDLFKKNDKK